MNLTKNSSYNWILTILKLAPVMILIVMLYTQTTTLIEFSQYLPTFSFSDTIVNYMSTIGINLGNIGTLACGYFNYLVMLHLIECLAEVVLFLPHLFIDFFQKMHR